MTNDSRAVRNVWVLVAAGRAGRAPPAAAWIYAAHPVAVLVTGFHGQFDSIALLFVLLSVAALESGHRDRSALWLAAGIATKSFPVLLVPFLDRPKPGAKPSRTWTYLAFGALAYVLVLTYLGYTSNPAL